MADAGEKIRKELGRRYPNYILVTCSEPSKDGKMQVEMWREGEPALLAYMLEGALETICQEDCDEEFLYQN